MTEQEFEMKFRELTEALEEGSLSPLDSVKEYIQLENERTKTFRQELKEKFPELLK